MWAFQRGGEDPKIKVDLAPQDRESLAKKIYCASCAAEITDEEARIAVDGAHGHCFANPAGYVFEIGCFARAPGCLVRGDPTREHSWFRGFAWSYAHCAMCDAHLGWCYDGNSVRFFGLILDRLVQDKN